MLVCILATALATLVASYFYLGDGPSSAPTISGRPLMLATWATVVALLAASSTRWLTHSVDHRRTGLLTCRERQGKRERYGYA